MLLVQNGIVSWDKLFGKSNLKFDSKNTDHFFKFPLNVEHSASTLKGAHWKRFFGKKFFKSLMSELKKLVLKTPKYEKENEKIFNCLEKILETLFASMKKYIAGISIHEGVLDDETVDTISTSFDYLYIFLSFFMIISGHTSNYVLDRVSTLAFDLFFKPNLGFSGMPSVESLNFDIKRNFNFRSAEGKEFAMRKLSLFHLEKNEMVELDSFGSTIFEMLTDAFAHSNSFFLFSPEAEHMKLLSFIEERIVEETPSRRVADMIVLKKHQLPNLPVFKDLKRYYKSCKELVKKLIQCEEERGTTFDIFHLENELVKHELREHQYLLLKKLVQKSGKLEKVITKPPSSVGMFQKCGTGKTHTILALFSAFSQTKSCSGCLCFSCLPPTLIEDWAHKIKNAKSLRLSEHFIIVNGADDFEKKLKKLSSFQRGKVILISVHVFVNVCLKYAGQKKKGMKSDFTKFFDDVIKSTVSIVFDEFHLVAQAMGSFSNLKIVKSLFSKVFFILMTATPFRNEML